METSYPGMKTEPQAFAQIEERKHNNLEPTEETLSLKPLGHVVTPGRTKQSVKD